MTEIKSSYPSTQFLQPRSPSEKVLHAILDKHALLFLHWLKNFKGDPFYLLDESFPEEELIAWFERIQVKDFPMVEDKEQEIPWLPIATLFQMVTADERDVLFNRYTSRFEFVVTTLMKSSAQDGRLIPITAPVFIALLCLGLNLPDSPSESNFTDGMQSILRRIWELQVGRYMMKENKIAHEELLTDEERLLPDLDSEELARRVALLQKIEGISFRISTATREKLAVIRGSRFVATS